jgi:hypothetical protein
VLFVCFQCQNDSDFATINFIAADLSAGSKRFKKKKNVLKTSWLLPLWLIVLILAKKTAIHIIYSSGNSHGVKLWFDVQFSTVFV